MATTTPRRNEPLRGGVLNPNAAIEQQFTASILAMVRRMAEETKKTLLDVFADAAHDAMDAGEREGAIEGHSNISSQARIAMNQLVERYEPLFARIAKKATKRMMDRTIQNSRVTLGASLREISASVSIDAKSMSPALLDVITASTNEAVGLIKIIPTNYLQKVQGAVMRSITTGNGLKDLTPFLEKAYGQFYKHAKIGDSIEGPRMPLRAMQHLGRLHCEDPVALAGVKRSAAHLMTRDEARRIAVNCVS